jgi:hypothetical protein
LPELLNVVLVGTAPTPEELLLRLRPELEGVMENPREGFSTSVPGSCTDPVEDGIATESPATSAVV